MKVKAPLAGAEVGIVGGDTGEALPTDRHL